ncbi:hypothetical protein KEM56_006722 [Ascosphaera pollenicola]|nr:hypothetical protein KEM56_006722 [Ascosphaera pollenicola]
MADSSELESFRRRWREEVQARQRQQVQHANEARAARTPPSDGRTGFIAAGNRPSSPPVVQQLETATASKTSTSRHDADTLHENVQSLSLDDDAFFNAPQESKRPPQSALEHFEEAVYKEAQGNLGQSLDLYRKAYRLDNDVDKAYRNKHFPKAKAPLSKAAAQTASANSNDVLKQDAPQLPTSELIASFAYAPIPQAEPLIENTPPPPCPLSHVPSEIIAEIIRCLAFQDPASLTSTALVCKRLAWHVSHEQSVYKLLCQSQRFGFTDMHYGWNTDILGHHLHTLYPISTVHPRWYANRNDIPSPFSSWREVYQSFPRIRFTGIYISTVNYSRPGAHSDLTSVSWGAPIHIVTYYRYLRFYPDGTVISLLTTTEPAEIVRYISKENIESLGSNVPAQRRQIRAHGRPHHQDMPEKQQAAATNPVPYAIQATLRTALKGRWRLKSPEINDQSSDIVDELQDIRAPPLSAHEEQVKAGCPEHDPRDLVIETEGIDPKYTFRMHLSLRSAHSRSTNVAKNTRLIWRSFWSYNESTDDWTEFGLRNDRPFIFSRVRGWGMT